jgi:hypothetical protein
VNKFEGLAMTTRKSEDDSVRGGELGSAVMPVARKISGMHEIDVRAGFEQAVRAGIENAFRCYREAEAARKAGANAEAVGFRSTAERSMAVAYEALAALEGM